MNYYMLFSEVSGIGLDELLAYVKKTIDINVEREKKHELLREKVNELKELFKKHNLDKLKRLKFSFSEEDLVPKLNDFDVDVDIDETYEEEIIETPQDFYPENVGEHLTSGEKEFNSSGNQTESNQPIPSYLDENGNPIELTEEELEMIEEEERAKRNIEMMKAKKQNDKVKNLSSKVELPPR